MNARRKAELAVLHGLRSIAFPAVSCGVYGYPMDQAAAISASVVQGQAWDLEEIRFVLFSDEATAAWTQALA